MTDEYYRKCDESTCELPATHYLVWLKPQYYCFIHAQKILDVGAVMGHPTAAATVRLMTIDEMIPDEE